MTKRITAFLGCMAAILASCLGVAALHAAEANSQPARFLSALDLDGRAHHLAEGEAAHVTALVFITTECPVAREFIPELNRLAAKFADQGVKFCGVIYQPSISRADAKKFQEEFKIEFPVLFDASGELAAALAPTRVPEAFVISTQGAVLYRGRIDDRYGEVGKKRSEATTHEFADALTAALAGQPVAVAETTPVGCPLETKPAANQQTKVTFNRDIAPIVFAQCSECHRAGEVAPFSLLSYEDVAKRADHLVEVTKSRLMPPWKAKIGEGRFLGERHLTDAQIALISDWVKAGSPEGDAADLPPQPKFTSGWRLGEPGLVVKAPSPFEMPADGPDIFQHFVIPLEDAAGRTVVGFEFRPGNPSIVHHAILFLDTSGVGRQKDEATPAPGWTTSGSIDIPVAGMLGVWTPGMTPRFFPKNVGMPIKPKTDLVLQLHLHPSGKVESDQSSIALYYAKPGEEPTSSTSTFVVGSLLIDIKAGEPNHTLKTSVTLPADMTLISLLPHMHLIGKEMKLTATLPDGTVKPLIWIDDWNFLWQDNYVYQEPVHLPAGTKLETLARYDNSAENPANPQKPPGRVLFGNDSTDEMCFGIFQMVANPGDERKIQMALMQAFMKEWSDAKIDPEARATIMEEAGKLFGGGRRGGLESLLGGGGGEGGKGEGRRRRREREAEKAAAEKADEKPAAESAEKP